MLKEFKEFAMKGNVLDMAVGIIIGAGFGKIVTSFVQDILMPPIGKLTGGVDFANYFISLSSGNFLPRLPDFRLCSRIEMLVRTCKRPHIPVRIFYNRSMHC